MKERKSERAKVGLSVHHKLGNLKYIFILPPFSLSLFRWITSPVFARLLLPLSLFCSFTISLHAQGIGPDNRFYVVHDYQDDWQVYDEVAKTYLPYLYEVQGDVPALSLPIDLESNQHYTLLLRTTKESHLFLDAALRKKIIAGQWYTFRVDSLYRVYRKPQLFLTIYGSAEPGEQQLMMAHPRSALQKTIVAGEDNLSVRPRPFSTYRDFFGLGLLFLLATHALLFASYRRAFGVFYNPRDLFTLRTRDESFLINRPLSVTNLLFVLNLSFVLAYLFLFVQSRNIDLFASRTLLLQQQSFGAMLLYYLLVSGLIFLAFMAKYLMLQVVGSLYRFDPIVNLHFFKIVQSSLIFFSIIIGLAVVVIFNIPHQMGLGGALLIPFSIFYLGRMVLLYLIIEVAGPIKSLYLISYLCIVELVPLLIGIRFAF